MEHSVQGFWKKSRGRVGALGDSGSVQRKLPPFRDSPGGRSRKGWDGWDGLEPQAQCWRLSSFCVRGAGSCSGAVAEPFRDNLYETRAQHKSAEHGLQSQIELGVWKGLFLAGNNAQSAWFLWTPDHRKWVEKMWKACSQGHYALQVGKGRKIRRQKFWA